MLSRQTLSDPGKSYSDYIKPLEYYYQKCQKIIENKSKKCLLISGSHIKTDNIRVVCTYYV